MTEKTTAVDPLLELLRKKLREIMNDRTDVVAAGGCNNFPAYTHETGLIKGLALAERELLVIDENQQID